MTNNLSKYLRFFFANKCESGVVLGSAMSKRGFRQPSSPGGKSPNGESKPKTTNKANQSRNWLSVVRQLRTLPQIGRRMYDSLFVMNILIVWLWILSLNNSYTWRHHNQQAIIPSIRINYTSHVQSLMNLKYCRDRSRVYLVDCHYQL